MTLEGMALALEVWFNLGGSGFGYEGSDYGFVAALEIYNGLLLYFIQRRQFIIPQLVLSFVVSVV